MIALLLSAAMLAADTNHCVVCPTLPPTSDTISETVYGTVSDPFTRLALPLGFSGIVAEAVRSKMKIPANLPIVVFDAHGRPTVVTTAAFSLMTNGTAQNVAEMASSSSPEIDGMLTVGIYSATRDSSFPPLPPGAGNGIRLAFSLSPDSVSGAVPMFSLRLPEWHEYAAARAPDGNVHGHNGADTLEVRLVIDEHGVPQLGTIHVVRAPRVLALSYLDWFRTSRFVPGHIQRCAVRSFVDLTGTLAVDGQFVPASARR